MSWKEEDRIFLRKYAAMAIGNMMEWFDFSSFGALIDIIGENFFPPGESHSMQLIKSLAIFGAAFVMRPIGGVAFGYIGDRVGRKRALEISILMMFFPSLMIGCLPTYKDIGYYSSVLLLALRLCQGLAAGGELVGAFLYTLEACKGRNVGFWGGATKASGNFGTTLGVGLVTVLRSTISKEQMHSWGWRIPFLASIVFGVVGLATRMSLTDDDVHDVAIIQRRRDDETGVHTATSNVEVNRSTIISRLQPNGQQQVAIAPNMSPLMQVITYYHLELCIIVLASMFWACSYYTTFVWLVYFMQDPSLIGGEAVDYAWYISFIANFCLVLSLPMGGSVGDFISKSVKSNAKGSAYTMQVACILMMILTIPAFLLIMTRQSGYALFGQFLFLAPVALYGANLPYFIMQMVNQRNLRYTAMGLGYNLSHALFSSTTSLIQTSLIISPWLAHHPHRGEDINKQIEHSKLVLDDPRLRPAYYLITVSLLVYLALTVGLEFCRNRRLNHGASVNRHSDIAEKTDANVEVVNHNDRDKSEYVATVHSNGDISYEALFAKDEDMDSDEEMSNDDYYNRWKHAKIQSHNIATAEAITPTAPPFKYQYLN